MTNKAATQADTRSLIQEEKITAMRAAIKEGRGFPATITPSECRLT